MPILLIMAWRNLWRHGRRSLLTALAMALGMAMSMSIISMYDGMFGIMRTLMIDQLLGHVQITHSAFPTRRGLYDTLHHADELLSRLDALPQSRGAVARVHGQALLGTEHRSAGVRLVGVEPSRELAVTKVQDTVPSSLPGGVDPGRFLADEPAREIVIGYDLARDLRVALGDELVAITQDAYGGIGNEVYTIVGLTRSGDEAMDRAGAWLHFSDLQALLALDDQVHEVRILAASDAQDVVGGLLDALPGALPDGLIQDDDATAAISPWWDIDPMAAQMMEMRGIAQFMVLVVVFGLVALGVINTMLMSVLERTRELGVIKALGLRPRGIVWLVLYEALLLSLLAAGIGTLLGAGLIAYLMTIGIPMDVGEGEGIGFGGIVFPSRLYGGISVEAFVEPILGVVLSALLAALLPALRAARLHPVDAIRAE
ncbi:MAG: ABC transporter permease [Deltaproteobacteria bacterium]|nr:MAG: ABC transporter permease [Deltaproteobacteria bacterium]